MEKFLRNAIVALALLSVANATLAKAQDFSVTTQSYGGTWVSTYRSLAPEGRGDGVAALPRDYAPLPTACDISGRGGFEVVTRQPGERQCVGGRR